MRPASLLGQMSLRNKLTARSRPEPAPVAPAPEPDPTAPWVDALLARPAPPATDPLGPVSAELASRLTAEDHAAVAEAMERPEEGYQRSLWEHAPPEVRPRLSVLFSTYYGIPGALERTGMLPQMPPEDVHAMARGALAAGGDPYTADIVMTSLQAAGFQFGPGATILDFGCSSGRVLRALAAWRPDLELVGCDPNADAIAWAVEHLPVARWFASPTTPPLDLGDASVDAAFAISIWSHFDAGPALTWLAEMHRVVRPGGALLITTHGLDTLGHYMREDLMTRESAAEVTRALITSGHHWYDVFGDEGDWGVKASGWGNGYMSMEWLTSHVTPDWAVRQYVPGGLHGDQDVVVLERR